MFKIVSKRVLSPNITEMKVLAPRVAESALPGQFVIVRTDEYGERIPLTICDYDREEGTVTIVTQTIGISSQKINSLEEGRLSPTSPALSVAPPTSWSSATTS